MKKPHYKAPVAEKKIDLVKEEKAPKIQEVKVGDLTKDGFKVIDIIDANRVLVSTQTMAKVIDKKDC